MPTEKPPTKRKALQTRASEASEVIQRLAERMPIAKIAERCRVSERSVYRWLHEGRAPHPLILDGLRRLEQETE
jgi:DNA-directed RNA polymerase specialized sigma24 family protein